MSKQRYINTKIWEDGWFSKLDQIEQLVFIYFLTNPMTNIIGAYELSKGTISRSVGLESLTLDVILTRFEKDKKVYYVDGWVVIPNFIKHQNYNSPKIKKGIEIELESVPEKIKGLIRYGIDTLSHSNSNSNINSNTKEVEQSSTEIPLLIKEFETINPAVKRMYGNKTQRKACEDLLNLYDFDRLIKIIKETIPKTNALPYFPTITTPLQLLEKYSSLENAIRKYQVSEKKLKNNIAFK